MIGVINYSFNYKSNTKKKKKKIGVNKYNIFMMLFNFNKMKVIYYS
jgi:hypothetical protein